jgi:general secretion pathway protein G
MIDNKKGFTLIELLVVIAIISLLSSIAVSSLSEARKKARFSAAATGFDNLGKAMELYRLDTGSYPTGTYSQVLTTLSPYLPQAPTLAGLTSPVPSITYWVSTSYKCQGQSGIPQYTMYFTTADTYFANYFKRLTNTTNTVFANWYCTHVPVD